jgi:hypothetical protein
MFGLGTRVEAGFGVFAWVRPFIESLLKYESIGSCCFNNFFRRALSRAISSSSCLLLSVSQDTKGVGLLTLEENQPSPADTVESIPAVVVGTGPGF